MTRNARLRALVAAPGLTVVPGVYDAYLARCVEAAGFEAVYMTGAGVSHARLGAPDLGLLTYSEMVDQAGRIADAVAIPVIADADTGYGNALNVMRTVRGYERAGVSALHIEDQEMPKRCGHFDRKRVVPTAEMLGRIAAALDARVDPDLVLIARTDARTALGFEAALERAHAYAEAGADMIFLESPRSEEELERVAREVPAPLLVNLVETGLTPLLPPERLEAMGYRIAIHPGAVGRFIGRQVGEFLARFRADRTTIPQLDRMLDFRRQNEIVDLPGHLARAARYAAPDADDETGA